MYLKFIVFKIIAEFVAFIIGLVLYPIAYLFRGSIHRNPTLWKYLGLYWVVNSDEPNFLDNWFGIYEIYNNDYIGFLQLNYWQKFCLSYKWGALRNPTYNFKLLLGKIFVGDWSPQFFDKIFLQDIKILAWDGIAPPVTWRNKHINGKQWIEFYINDVKHFRYSFTKKIYKKYKLNFMAGTNWDRLLLKVRIFS